MKVVPSNNDITPGACSCKLASTHTYCIDSNYKEPSVDLETNTKSNKNLDKIRNQQNKNLTEKLELIILTKRTKNESAVQRITHRKKRKKTRKINDMNMARKLETLKMMYPRKNRRLYTF